MKIIVASNNNGKIKEIKTLLNRDDVYSLKDVFFEEEIEEYGDDFYLNALIKAMTLAKYFPNDIILSDDSGLCVEELAGKPGVRSARYAIKDELYQTNKDLANNKKLLKKMEGKENRRAFFKTVICLIKPHQEPQFYSGILKGEISTEFSEDKNGFGYDPVFKYKNQYLSSISLREKNKISHRAQALKKIQLD